MAGKQVAWILLGAAMLLVALGGVVALRLKRAPAVSTPNVPGMSFTLTSPAFSYGEPIPPRYTCDGEDLNPPLQWRDAPEGTRSFVLVMDDPDAPMGVWDHWVVFNIPPSVQEVPEGVMPEGVPGRNSWGRTDYGGPCPPDGEHRYRFAVYALDTLLDLPAGATKEEVYAAMEGHVLASAELVGRYRRPSL